MELDMTKELRPPRPRLRGSLDAAAVVALAGSWLAILLTCAMPKGWPLCLVSPFVPHWGFLGLGAWCVHCFAARRPRELLRWTVRVLGLAAPLFALAVTFGGFAGRKVPAMANPIEASSPEISVLVCNVHSENRDFAAVESLIRERNADLVLLLEINRHWLAGLQGLPKSYAHHLERPDDAGNFGIGLWSKHAIVSGGIVEPDGKGAVREVPQIDVRLRIMGARDVHFLGIHPLPPVSARAVERRDAVLHWVADRCAAVAPLPTIVAGDFNATPYCAATLELAARTQLSDATASLHQTWPTGLCYRLLAIRIDHVWASSGVTCKEAGLCPFVGSDHLPVFARLMLPAER